VVCGTTGWSVGSPVRDAVEQAGIGAVIAPNFSLGMDLFARLVAEAGRSLGRAGVHQPYLFEMHHSEKRDAPSGTARKLARLLLEVDPRLTTIVEGNPAGALPAGALHVASLRAGGEPGTHCVGFDGEHDRITLTHRASGRSGFALGAVLAAEWVRGRRGVFDFRTVVDALLERGQSI
jgi:4-hydroxy-tetrahydrodipicolinate reductase